MVLPGRNPILVAKAMSSLDRLSGGRLLPAFGLGVADPHEQQAYGVERSRPGGLVRRGPAPPAPASGRRTSSTTTATTSSTSRSRVLPKPIQQPLDVWMGGAAPRSCAGWAAWPTAGCPRTARPRTYRRRGPRSRRPPTGPDGPSTRALRRLVPYAPGGDLPDSVVRPAGHAAGPGPIRRPSSRWGCPACAGHLEALVEVGASKFVLVPTTEPAQLVGRARGRRGRRAAPAGLDPGAHRGPVRPDEARRALGVGPGATPAELRPGLAAARPGGPSRRGPGRHRRRRAHGPDQRRLHAPAGGGTGGRAHRAAGHRRPPGPRPAAGRAGVGSGTIVFDGSPTATFLAPARGRLPGRRRDPHRPGRRAAGDPRRRAGARHLLGPRRHRGSPGREDGGDGEHRGPERPAQGPRRRPPPRPPRRARPGDQP